MSVSKKSYLNSEPILNVSQPETAHKIPGPAGDLESLVYQAEASESVAIICHPHPLFQGTMHNKVIYTLSRTFYQAGITAVRFNYRGVGKSEGSFGHSEGEIEDLLAVIAWVKHHLSPKQFYFAGFSFGAYIAASGASQEKCTQLISIAPAVTNQPYASLKNITCPWLVVQGEEDEIISPQAVYDWVSEEKQRHPQILLEKIPEATHFFHGKLNVLRTIVEEHLVK